MRKITVYQKGIGNLDIFDDSNIPLDEYCKELSTIFKMKNIAIVKTSTSTIILRPSQITGIEVQEIDDLVEEEIISLENDIKETEEKIEEDIITDMD